MATALDRRLQKLEAATKGGADEKTVRVAFIHAGQNRDQEIARQLGELRPSDIVVRFVGVGDVPRHGEVLQ